MYFQRRILGYLRERVRVTCVRRIEDFTILINTRFSSFVEFLARADVGGVVVASGSAGDLMAAVAKALMATIPNLTKDDAARQTMTMVSIVTKCRLLRPLSYVDLSDWPLLREDPETDGIFVMQSNTGHTPRNVRHLAEWGKVRPPSSLRNLKRLQAGLFDGARIRKCKIRRRGTSFCRSSLSDALYAAGAVSSLARCKECMELWVFRPADTRMLGRVLCALRNGPNGRPPVPNILELHMFRCAAATRVQAVWRGHVSRWNLSAPLASCLILYRAVVCLQRWWRTLSGLGARMRLCRRLWALASAVSCSTLYIELDVFFVLSRGWRRSSDERGAVKFAFEDRGTVMEVMEGAVETRQGWNTTSNPCFPRGFVEPRGVRRLPLWASGRVIPHATRAEVGRRQVLSQVGMLVTEGVQAKRVVWPIAAATATAISTSADEQRPGADGGGATSSAWQTRGNHIKTIESSSTEIWAASYESATNLTSAGNGFVTSYSRAKEDETLPSIGPPLDLRESHPGVEIVELTFSSAREARARALLLAVATEEPGLAPARPIAQLMTLEMLRRAAAGRPGRAVPTLVTPTIGYQRGDNVEMSMMRLSEGFGGSWYPGVVERNNGDGKFQVILIFLVVVAAEEIPAGVAMLIHFMGSSASSRRNTTYFYRMFPMLRATHPH